jgi:hypothetical protein
MRHALLIVAGVLGIGAAWACSLFLRNLLVGRFKGSKEVFGMIAKNGISGIAAIVSVIILSYISLIW